MQAKLHLNILPQPDDLTCGPTCLHALYHYYGDELPLQQVIAQSRSLDAGGTLAVFLGLHALQRGYKARIYTYNLEVFDPTWFVPNKLDLVSKLRAQMAVKPAQPMQDVTSGYVEFLKLGGAIEYKDLTKALLRHYLKQGAPILTGLSATYLYQSAREIPETDEYDDLLGQPSGHFVVLCGYHSKTHLITVADPMHPNPMAPTQYYDVDIDRVVNAILLGVLTHDANLLIIRPKNRKK